MTRVPDYARLIDAETWAFIRKTAEAYPEDAVDKSVATQRAAYDVMCAHFHAGRPDGATVQDLDFNGTQLRHYRAAPLPSAQVLYLHGGGFVVGGLDSHDDVCAEIAAKTGFDVTAVDYRLAPEHAHPAAFEDALASLSWARENLRLPIVLVGDSAGGNLAAALAHHCRGDADILGQVLIYPGLGGDIDTGSYLTHANAPMLTRDDILYYEHIRVAGQPPNGDATYAPLWDVSFAGLPPTVTIAAECDPLCDDGRVYCEKIRAAGGTAVDIEEAGLVHGYLRARHSVARAGESFARITRSIRMIGNREFDQLESLRP